MPPNPAQQRADVFLRKSIRRLNTRLDKAVAELPDAKGVHAVRVSARRLRSVIRQFEAQFPAEAQQLRERLRDLANGFSDLRDLDVLLANLERWSRKIGEREAIAPLMERLASKRAPLLKKAKRALKRWQDSGGRDELEQLTKPDDWPQAARVPIGEIAPEMIHRAYEDFDKAVRRARKKRTLKRYHKLRIRGKRLRYVVTALSGLFDEQAKPVVKGLVSVQDNFGEYLDASNAAEVLKAENRRRELNAGARTVVNKLIAYCEQHADKQLGKMPGLLEKLHPQQWEAFMNDIRRGTP